MLLSVHSLKHYSKDDLLAALIETDLSNVYCSNVDKHGMF